METQPYTPPGAEKKAEGTDILSLLFKPLFSAKDYTTEQLEEQEQAIKDYAEGEEMQKISNPIEREKTALALLKLKTEVGVELLKRHRRQVKRGGKAPSKR